MAATCLLALAACVHEPEVLAVFPDAAQRAENQATGNRVRNLVLKAEAVELVSLDPLRASLEEQLIPPSYKRLPSTGLLDDFRIVGRANTSSRTEISKLAEALRKGIAESSVSAMCFLPRHALLFKTGEDEIQVVVCFHCSSGRVNINGKRTLSFAITSESEAPFDRVFSRHGLPKAEFPTEENVKP